MIELSNTDTLTPQDHQKLLRDFNVNRNKIPLTKMVLILLPTHYKDSPNRSTIL